MADYKIGGGLIVLRTSDGASIPADANNRDWIDYQAWLAAGNTPDPYQTADEILAAAKLAVNAERDRRASLGFTFNGVVYQSDEKSMNTIDRHAGLAFVAITNGAAAGNYRWSDPNADYYFIAADNSHVIMDAPTVVALNQAATAFNSNLALKASTLKAMNPIPTDYAADKYWS